MQTLYADTSLTPLRVARFNSYIDWNSQPSLFKHYPDFLFRYRYDEIPALKLAELSRCITSCTSVAGKPYYRLNTPSAGNLHPIEVYVQIRGIKGVISGMYHVDAKNACLVLIQEIQKDGVEPLLGLSKRFNGMLFIVTIVPFRSEWKYGNRAIRYCYIDAGHQTGAIVAASHVLGQKATILSDIDALSLNEFLGFDREEFACMAVAIGEETQKNVETLSSSLMHVSPTDYSEGTNAFSGYLDHFKYTASHPSLQVCIEKPSTLQTRRSARFFADTSLQEQVAAYFIKRISEVSLPLGAFIVILKNGTKEPGVYQNSTVQKQGDFTDTITHLLIDQSFIKNAAMVIVFTAPTLSTQALTYAGAYAHMLHLEAVEHGLGFTGIGAFYDAKLQDFLDTQEVILYVCALGEQRA